MIKPTSFTERMKRHQREWAEKRYGEVFEEKHPWVFKPEHKRKNLLKDSWWEYIHGKEHRWVHNLNSSQCFAVNLFGPLADNPLLARLVLTELIPDRVIRQDDEVTVQFEHTPEGAKGWLGETKTSQPTQVDVFFTVSRNGLPIGYLLVEVKLTEKKFGSCRGAVQSTEKRPGNPYPDRCNNLLAVIDDPVKQCWMAESDNGRLYWDLMKVSHLNFRPKEPAHLAIASQLMRNQVLATALLKEPKAEWTELAVCIHPGNDRVYHLNDPIEGETHALGAFNKLLPAQTKRIRELEPFHIVQTVRSIDSNLSEWSDWVSGRYDLAPYTTKVQ